MPPDTAAGLPVRWDGVMGMNARNALIAALNPASAVRLVNRKHETKQALEAHGIPVAPTLGVAATRHELDKLVAGLPDRWAIKPNRGRAGGGILLAAHQTEQGWLTPGGRPFSYADVLTRGRQILNGEHSMGDSEDLVLAEPLLQTHPTLEPLTPAGLPDLRLVVHGDSVLAAMLRLPTAASEGKANLHQGGIGVAIDIGDGHSTNALHAGHAITHHPDTDETLDIVVPAWNEILNMSRRCGPALGLGYYGADIVLDADLGPIVIEVNAHPGLEIQNVTRTHLRTALEPVPSKRASRWL